MTARDTQRQRSHEAILRSTATLLKERGIRGTRLADVMDRAGLTVGGFYAHFHSKADLVDEALRRALAARRARLDPWAGQPWRRRIGHMVSGYLTRDHRDDRTGGCPLPTVVGEIARDDTGKSALRDEVLALVEALGDRDDPAARRSALATIALTSGGLALARAVGDDQLSDDVLHACREFAETALHNGEHPR